VPVVPSYTRRICRRSDRDGKRTRDRARRERKRQTCLGSKSFRRLINGLRTLFTSVCFFHHGLELERLRHDRASQAMLVELRSCG